MLRRDLDRIFVQFISIEIEIDAASDNKWPDCGKEKNRKKKSEEVGAWLGDRSGQSLPRGLFLRCAILLCLNEVGDLTHLWRPTSPPRSSYIAGNFVSSVLRSFNSASKTPSSLRRCPRYKTGRSVFTG